MQPDNLQRSLEAELATNPDDIATHAAYADLLSEQGDPRGELIQVQLALEDPELPPQRQEELLRRETELLQAHQRHWLGPLASHLLDDPGITFAIQRGWLDLLECDRLSLKLARVLRDAPQARLLRSLAIRDAHRQEDIDFLPDDGIPDDESQVGFWPLVGSRNLANVRHCVLGEDDGDDWDAYQCNFVTTGVPLLVRGMPRLEELRLFADGYSLAELFILPTLRNLRILQVHHVSAVYRLDLLANNPACQHLTHLLLHPHALAWHRNRVSDEAAGFRGAEGYLPLSVVRPLLFSWHLSRLTHLRLRVSSMGDEGCTEIVRSGILARLKDLDLRHGRITDQGARILADQPQIRGLDLLDLDRNRLSAEGVARMKALGISVRVDDQRSPATDDNGASAEDEYLYEGEFE